MSNILCKNNELDSILKEYDRQFIEMQNEFINILTSIKNKDNIYEIKDLCQKNINIIKKDQSITSSNIYDMNGKLL